MPARGVTLFELMLTLFLLTLVSAAVLPGTLGLLRKSEAVRANTEIVAMLQVARYEAAARRQPVLMCAVSADGRCMAVWRERVVMFVDIDNDQRLGAADMVLHRSGALPEEISLRWQSFRQQPYIVWNTLGQTHASNGTLTLCHSSGRPELMRRIVINRAGRVRQTPYESPGEGGECR